MPTFSFPSLNAAALQVLLALGSPPEEAEIVAESLAGEPTGQPFSLEARYRRNDGVYRWLKSFSRPRFGAGGEIIGFVGVAFDVTEMRESQARLLESIRRLAGGVPVTLGVRDAHHDYSF